MNISQKSQLLEMLPKMTKIDAIQCSNQFQKDYQTRINWHEFSNYLDELHSKGILELIGHNSGGMTQYKLNR